MKLKSQLLLILFATALLVFFYVWPGVWRYRYYKDDEIIVRVDKLTGKVQSLVWSEGGDWRKKNDSGGFGYSFE